MKRTVFVLLLAALLLVSLAGCGSTNDSGLPPVSTANVSSLKPIEIPTMEYSHSEITPVTVAPLEPIEIPTMEYSFPEITPMTVAPLESITITVPEYNFKPIEAVGVEFSVPEVDYEISSDRIGSAYTDTYTVPDIQVETPNFDQPELNQVFVGIADNLSPEQQAELAGMSDREFAEIAAVQMSLTDMLTEAYKYAGVTLAIDPMTGAIPIDASLLYDTDKYELKPEGKEALKAVFMVYYAVISQPEFRDAVDSIVIEGHTDTEGDHAYNQALSEKRAQAVREFLLSDECGLPDRAFLEKLLTTVGRSYDDPVYNADGSVNMAASRRVEVRFTLNLNS